MSQSKKGVPIKVNLEDHLVPEGKISYWQVVHFPFPDAQPDPLFEYKVSWLRPKASHGLDKTGILVDGAEVEVTKDMEFVCVKSNRS